jgi:hypothetical protein
LQNNSDPKSHNLVLRQHIASALARLAISDNAPEWVLSALEAFIPTIKRLTMTRQQFEPLLIAATCEDRFRFLLPLLVRSANLYLRTFISKNEKAETPIDISPIFEMNADDSLGRGLITRRTRCGHR